MLQPSATSLFKSLVVVLLSVPSISVFAQPLHCAKVKALYCKARFQNDREQLAQKQLTALWVTDAPIKLLRDTEQTWLQRIAQCSSNRCVAQQFEQRDDDLNIYTSLNQSLTQHYLKYEAGQLAMPAVHLKVHQLDKSHIKIEGVAYRSPNNRIETQQVHFLAYTTPEQKQTIRNNEQGCDYDFNFQKAILTVSTSQAGCERFTGIYRLYD